MQGLVGHDQGKWDELQKLIKWFTIKIRPALTLRSTFIDTSFQSTKLTRRKQ